MRRFGLVAALAGLLLAAPATAVEAAPVSALMGLGPVEVRNRLAEEARPWPLQPTFQVATPEGVLTFITVGDLMLDPALAEQLAVWRTRGDHAPRTPYLVCKAALLRGERLPVLAHDVVLTFRNGRLVSAALPDPPPARPTPPTSDRKAWEMFIRTPALSPFQPRQGALPLEDGPGFLSRWARTELGPTDALSATCAPPPPPPPPAPTKARKPLDLDASDLQGLSLLPFAVTLPGKNAQRTAASRDGPALLATLRVGEPLGAAPEAFAAAHRGMRAYTAGDYAVLSLDLGAAPGRNLSNFNDAALIGVRGGRIEWIAPPAGFGPRPDLLCIDEHGVAATPRKGCGGWGHFNP